MKKVKYYKYLLVALIIMLAITLASCNIKVGYVGSNIGNTIKASYKKFNGEEIKKISAETDETVVVSYTSTVEEGELAITVQDSEKETVTELETGVSGTETLTIGQNAPYRIVITGQDTKGSFEVSWEPAR